MKFKKSQKLKRKKFFMTHLIKLLYIIALNKQFGDTIY
jgi:hypothetical protein